MGKRGHIGDRSAAGIRLVLANDPERLAPTVVAQDRDRGAEHNDDRVCRLRLRNRARNAFREIARIPRGELQSATALVGVLYRLSGFERLLAVGEGPLERTRPDRVTRLGCAEIARGGRLTSCAAAALSSRTKATLIVAPP
jgi:hypothetical protein